ncbi:MAG: glutamine synthetase III [Halobacteriovoraceae bacterium]|nr:glutamine synthetase III [Halobacteriovoraceae bacterium]
MTLQTAQIDAKRLAVSRSHRKIQRPLDSQGNPARIIEYYGENIFDFRQAKNIPEAVKKELEVIATSNKPLPRDLADVVAKTAMEWAMSRGATHFCHWFQPLTGSTAEKHDSFLDIKDGEAIENLSAGQLMQGEPDASSFPNGGSRSTFEARGYTSWDLTSPMFLIEGVNGLTLCIPTAFISYTGQALDIKTPLLRSEVAVNKAAKRFLKAIGQETERVVSNCGPEQEYFLIDEVFYYSRPDLIMTGRTLFGSLSTKNQQLDDHYFGDISERVMGFMQELDLELHRLGIPSKTRHNEVAPGQYEIAPIFTNTNVAADQNQIMMATLKRVAHKHHFVCLIHEKPFAGINGSGKHLNWSLSTVEGDNLLNPGKTPEKNPRFLTMVAATVEALNRHGGILRASIASAGNDHRLGANEAPPSIISAYLGDTLERIFTAIKDGKKLNLDAESPMDVGTQQLANLDKDNTDRNRTSPFAFTGNKFELRACGSEMSIGLPLSILNGAVADVLNETAEDIEKLVSAGKSADEAMQEVTKKLITNAWAVIFNGDGYSDEWVKEAEKRGLLNLKTTADALPLYNDEKRTAFLRDQNIYTKEELETRFHVLVERYNTLREIEFLTLVQLVNQHVLPSVFNYKLQLGNLIKMQKDISYDSSVEGAIYKRVNYTTETLFNRVENLNNGLKELPEEGQKRSKMIADTLMPLSTEIADLCGELEEVIPEAEWTLPTYQDMLFLR